MEPLSSSQPTTEVLVDQQNIPIIYRVNESGGLYHALLTTGDSQTPVLIPAEALSQLLQEAKDGTEDEAQFLLEKQTLEQEVATTYIEIQKIETSQVNEDSTPKKSKKKSSPTKKKKDSTKKKTPSKRQNVKASEPVELPPGCILTATSLLGDDKLLDDSREYSVLGQSLSLEPTLSELNSGDREERLKQFVLSKVMKSESLSSDLKQATPITVLAEGGIANLAALQAGIIPLPLSLLQQAAASQGVSLKTGSHSLHLKLSPSDVPANSALLGLSEEPGDLTIPDELQEDLNATSQLLSASPVSTSTKKVIKTPAMRSLLVKRPGAMRTILPKGGLEALQKLMQSKEPDEEPITSVVTSDPPIETQDTDLNLSICAEDMIDYSPVKNQDIAAAYHTFDEGPVVDVIEKPLVVTEEENVEEANHAAQKEFQDTEEESEVASVPGEVFGKMSVTLSEEMLRCIPKSTVAFLHQLAKDNGCQLRAVPDKNLFSLVCNRFTDLTRIHAVLDKLMTPSKAVQEKVIDESEETADETKEVVEKVAKKRGRPRGKAKKTEPKAPPESDEIAVETTIEDPPQFSRSGRRLKLRTYPSIKVESSIGDDVDEELIVAPPVMRTRKQRKLVEEEKEMDENGGEVEMSEKENQEENIEEGELKYDVELPQESLLFENQLGHKYVKKRDYEAECGYKFFCKLCSFKTKRQSHYDNHLRLHQSSHSLFKCGKCSFTALRLNHLRRHEQTHIAQKILQCAKCPYKSLKADLMARHCHKRHQMQSKTSEAIYKCRSCDYKTNRQHLIVRHLRVHDITNGEAPTGFIDKLTKSYECAKCGYTTGRKENYIRHMNNVHIPLRPYLCDTCGKSFKRQDSLRAHTVVHLDRTKRQYSYKCYVCQKGLRSKAHLKEHLTTHSSQRAHLCEICGASFKTRSVQRKHVQSIHQNPHSFYCMECPKTFNTKYSLLRHSKTHKGDAHQPLLMADPQNEIILPELAADGLHQIQIEYPSGEIVTQPIVQVPQLLQAGDVITEDEKNVLTSTSLEGASLEVTSEGFDPSIVQHMESRTLLSAESSTAALFYLN